MTVGAIGRDRSKDYNILTGKNPSLTRRILADHSNERLLDIICSHLVISATFCGNRLGSVPSEPRGS